MLMLNTEVFANFMAYCYRFLKTTIILKQLFSAAKLFGSVVCALKVTASATASVETRTLSYICIKLPK